MISTFQDGKKAHASKKYSDAIDYYTQAVDHLKTDLESVILLHRAAAYEQQHERELVSRDTELAYTNSNDNSSDGHIVHENAPLLDKEYNGPLQAYQAGLTALKNDNNDNQDTNKLLNENDQGLSTNIQNRNYFSFQILPNTIISTILANLSVKDRVQLGMTSRSWNTFIQQWRSMYYEINMHRDLSNDMTINKKLFDAIPEDEPRNVILGMSDREIAHNGIPAYFLDNINGYKLNTINSLGKNN